MITFDKKQHAGALSGFLVLCFLFAAGCGEQEIPAPEPAPSQEQTANQWIEDSMRKYYLWEKQIPEKEKLDFTQDETSFFFSLLADEDGKTPQGGEHYYYSSINKKSASKSATRSYLGDDYSFGFEFQYYYIRNLKKYALLTLYVLPGSPAAEEGLKRGDWIMTIGGEPVSGDTESLLTLLYPASPVTQTFGLASSPELSLSGDIRLTAAVLEDDPVFLSKTIAYQGRKIGYLVYNHFTDGPTDDDPDKANLFDLRLREAFRRFKTEKPDEFVLDLRYNGGGLVRSAQLLASLLAPASALDDVFCHLTYNGRQNGYANQTLTLDSKEIDAASENLNLKRLYVIVSSRTASASEALVNGLRPYMDVVLTGEQTEGKNVGSVTFDDERFDWELHPIVSRLSNKDGFSDYEKGFAPDVLCEESKTDVYYELGDEREFMLETALAHLTGSTRNASLRSASKFAGTLLYHSPDRRKTNGALLDF